MDSVNLERLEHMIGGPLSTHITHAFNRLENQARVTSAETHPSGWILAICNEISFLSGRIADLEKKLDPEDDSGSLEQSEQGNISDLHVQIKGEVYRAQFMGMTEKGYYRVRVEGEDKIRVVAPDKVNTNG